MPDFLKDYFTDLSEGLFSTLNTPDAYFNKIALTVIVVVLAALFYFLVKKLLTRNEADFKKRLKSQKVLKSGVMVLAILSILFIWIQAINALILIALLIGVFLAFMVRGLTTNITAYFVIKYWKYFEISNRIEINGIIGDVIDITPINLKLLEVRGGLSADANTGRVIKLPNSIIFNESLEIVGGKNSFVWQEISYVLSFDSDWQAAEKMITEAGETYFEEQVQHQLKKDILHLSEQQAALRPVFSVDTNDAGIVLVLRYLVDYQHGTQVKTELQRKILPQLISCSAIEFAVLEVKVFRG
ncbi:mechanosensitive ion channel [Planococcus sp. ANT_H30]|uniref:mechanosensitive ion channel domain-containing protein n=1 Tax=Planococcus sp. ANT_H30 TaxID=2597347 RepID=UPI0011F0988D|nr:mechanosensitive ion channel domain-containing protein [Planococcus sp. ANT_H30]KAA0955344.1 mechanosensitive ion channel [Planococcus sp. ANT_H30]